MNKQVLALSCALSLSLIAHASLSQPVHQPEGAEIERDCINQYNEAKKTGKTSLDRAAFVNHCVGGSALFKNSGAREKDCIRQFDVARREGKATSQEEFVKQCMMVR